jgi:hypothetical protein
MKYQDLNSEKYLKSKLKAPRGRAPDPAYIEGQRILVEAMKYLAQQDPAGNREAVLLLSEHFRTRFRISDHPGVGSNEPVAQPSEPQSGKVDIEKRVRARLRIYPQKLMGLAPKRLPDAEEQRNPQTTSEKEGFYLAVGPDVSVKQLKATLETLADYYRACGGAGFHAEVSGETS